MDFQKKYTSYSTISRSILSPWLVTLNKVLSGPKSLLHLHCRFLDGRDPEYGSGLLVLWGCSGPGWGAGPGRMEGEQEETSQTDDP